MRLSARPAPRTLAAAACAAVAVAATSFAACAYPGAAPPAALPPDRGVASERPTGFPARCAPGEVEVMLLGTYHFANPGRDVVKTDVTDVLTPARQAELEELSARLAQWRPDQVAVEWPADFADSTRARYARYAAGTLTPNRNEVVQLGFRLAKRLGLPGVDPIDAEMRIGNDSVGAVLARRPDLKRLSDSVNASLQAGADSGGAEFRALPLAAQFRDMNGEAALHAGNSRGMFGALLPLGEGGNYGGPQVLARWYERNLRMVHHLYRALRPGTRRVLVVVGSGHVPPLRNLLDEAPQFCPVSPLPYLGGA